MQKSIFFFFLFWAMLAVVACKQNTTEPSSTTSASTTQANASLASLLDQYYEERMSYYPQEATQNGDNRFNDQLPNDISADFRGKVRAFYQKYQSEIQKIDRNSLNSNDQASYDIFTYEMKMNLEALTYDAAWQIPFQQFWGLPITMGQSGGGESVQPFKTVKDYDDWLKRITALPLGAIPPLPTLKQVWQQATFCPKPWSLK
jgi:uncharacterized protein (DUF885 family)